MNSEIFSYEIKENNETYSLEYFLKKQYLIIHVSTGEGSSSDPKSEYEQKYSLQSLIDASQVFRVYEKIEDVPEFLKTLLEDDKINLETKDNSVHIKLHTYMGKLKEPVLIIPLKEQDYSNFVKDFSKNLDLLKSQFEEENASLKKELDNLKQENTILKNWKENHMKEFKKMKDSLSNDLDENKKEDDELKKRVEELESAFDTLEKDMKKLEDENAEQKKTIAELQNKIKENNINPIEEDKTKNNKCT